MSEFKEPHNVARLIGAPPGYVGYDAGGMLTEAIRHKPYSVILFDEFEKAHPQVFDILLQVFEDGRLTDGRGKLVDFRNTLIIMTSNIGTGEALENMVNDEEGVRAELSRLLRPEFVNRIDEIVVFHKLGSVHLERLIDRYLVTLNDRLVEKGIRIVLGKKLREQLVATGKSGGHGGRALRRLFHSLILDTVSDRILLDGEKLRGLWTLEVNPDGEVVWKEDLSPQLLLPPARNL